MCENPFASALRSTQVAVCGVEMIADGGAGDIERVGDPPLVVSGEGEDERLELPRGERLLRDDALATPPSGRERK